MFRKLNLHYPVTANDLKLETKYKGLSTELIYDGVIIEQNLKQFNLDEDWLAAKLKEHGINNASEVLLANLETDGTLYVDKYQDPLKIPVNFNIKDAIENEKWDHAEQSREKVKAKWSH